MKQLCFICLIAGAIIFSGCSGHDNENKLKDSSSTADTGLLADKNFAFKNISNTLFENKFKEHNGKLYADSTYTLAFVELSKAQKVKFLAASMKKEVGVNSEYVRDMMGAYFIAKQEKIGNLQPIIVQVGGDDYGALKMILLDNKNSVVNVFNITGGMLGGPSTIGDSLTQYEARNYSYLNKNIVTNTVISISDYDDSLKKPSIVDSNVFKILIHNTGKISTKQIVHKEYRKAHNP
ncbi:hypothetical protein ACFGVR_05405 [Mucilaginibacter sp. AW1-3]